MLEGVGACGLRRTSTQRSASPTSSAHSRTKYQRLEHAARACSPYAPPVHAGVSVGGELSCMWHQREALDVSIPRMCNRLCYALRPCRYVWLCLSVRLGGCVFFISSAPSGTRFIFLFPSLLSEPHSMLRCALSLVSYMSPGEWDGLGRHTAGCRSTGVRKDAVGVVNLCCPLDSG